MASSRQIRMFTPNGATHKNTSWPPICPLVIADHAESRCIMSGRLAHGSALKSRGLRFAVDGCLVALTGTQGKDGGAMEITELPPTPAVLPTMG